MSDSSSQATEMAQPRTDRDIRAERRKAQQTDTSQTGRKSQLSSGRLTTTPKQTSKQSKSKQAAHVASTPTPVASMPTPVARHTSDDEVSLPSVASSLQRRAEDLSHLFGQDTDWTADPIPAALYALFFRMRYTKDDIMAAQTLKLNSIAAFISHAEESVEDVCTRYARRDLKDPIFQMMLIRAAVLGSHFKDLGRRIFNQTKDVELSYPDDDHYTDIFINRYLDFDDLRAHYKDNLSAVRKEYLDYIDDYTSKDSLVGSTVHSKQKSLSHLQRKKGGSVISIHSEITTRSRASNHSKIDPPSQQDTVKSTPTVGSHSAESKPSIPGLSHAFVPTPDLVQARNQNHTVMTNDVQAGLEFLGKLQNGMLTGMPPRSKIPYRKACPPLSKEITWNNKLEDFPKFKGKFRGHYMQASRGYLFRKEFIDAYLEEGYSCWTKFPDDIQSEAQLREDSMSILGGLLVATSDCHSGKEIIKRYESNGDGIRAWHEYDKKFNSDGHKDIRIRKLENVIGTVFHNKYKGGLAQWISDYENAFAELIELHTEDGSRSTWEDDGPKKRRLFQNAQNTGVPPTIMEEIAKDKDFSEAAMLLRKHALIQNDEYKQAAARNVHSTGTSSNNNSSTNNSSTKNNKSSDVTDAVICKLTKVPFALWSTMSDEVKKWIIEERMRLNKEDRNSRHPPTEKSETSPVKNSDSSNPTSTPPQTPKKPSSTLPNQYSKTNQVTTDEEEEYQHVDEFLAQAMCRLTQSHCEDRNVNMTRICYVADHSHSVARIMNALALESHQQLALSDNGSDSTVIGSAWYILNQDAFRTVTLSGLYNFVNGKRLPIVSGISACDLPDGKTVILQASEAIYDKQLNHTILSEFQMSEAGNIVDSRPKRHNGKQSITIPDNDGDVELPLSLSAALLYLTLRHPTEDEIASVDAGEVTVYKLTSDKKPWRPAEYSDSASQAFMEAVQEQENDSANIFSHTSTSDPLQDTQLDTNGAKVHVEDVPLPQEAEDEKPLDDTFFDSVDILPHDVEDNLFYFDPSDDIDEDCPGEHVRITFTTVDDPLDHWPPDLGMGSPSILDPPTYEDLEERNAMLNHVLGLDEENLDNYFDPTIVSDSLRSKYTVAIPTKQHLSKLEKYFAYRPPEIIKKTLQQTTQLAKAVLRFPLRRHLKPRFQMLRWPRLNEVVATDTYFSSVTSIEGYNCSQVFYGCTSRKLHVEGMRTESQFPDAYMDFIRKNGIPHTLRRDNAKAQKSKQVQEIHRDLIISDQWTEPHSPWQNPAEMNGVKYLKNHSQVLMDRTNTPPNLWFLCHQYLVDIYNVCAHPQLNWKIPAQVAGGDTPDISHILCFYWMEPVLYLDPNEKFPASKEKPGFFVGFADCVGDALTFKILLDDMQTVLHRSVVRSANDPKHRNRRVKFHDEVEEEMNKQDQETGFAQFKEDDEDGPVVKSEGIEMQDDAPISGRTRSKVSGTFKVEQKVQSKDSWWKGSTTLVLFATFQLVNYMLNPSFYAMTPPNILDQIGFKETEVYEKANNEFMSNANLWDKLKYVQALDLLNEEDEPESLLWNCKRVLKHRQVKRQGRSVVEVKCQWNDPNENQTWVDMNALVLQDPIPIIVYARANHVLDQAPFKNLVRYCTGDAPSNLARMYKMKTKGHSPKFKFGVQVPLGMKHAYQLDKINGDKLWQTAIEKELKQLNDYNTFRRLRPGEKISKEYQKIPYHIIFDVKFDLRRKARLVAGGNWTNPGKEDLYSGVVGMESVRLGFFLGEQNGLSCCAADVGNAFLYGKTKEKVYIIAGPEFGPELQGSVLIIYKSLYGLRTSAARFHEHCAEKLRELGFKPSKFDSDFWYKDMGTHYEYLATFVDDLLVWSKDPMAVIEELKKTYILKGVGVPEYYLGGDVEILDQHWKEDGVGIALSSKTYIKNVVPKFESLFGETFRTFKTPMAEEYHPEIDDSPLLDDLHIAKFRSIIGSANWIITLGRFDINYATSALSRFNMAPREGHLQAAKRVLGYLKLFPKGRTIFDTSYPDHEGFPIDDHPNWKEFYPDAEEDIPIDIPLAKGKPIRITVYVDADHAHDVVTRRSITGILLLLNNTPFRFVCKRQKTVETSTYGSELVAARVATDLIIETRYMLRTIGARIDGPALMLGDNMSVVLNTSVPSSVLKKKHCAISYHRVREAIAAKIMRFAHISSSENIADVLTKPLPNKTFHYLVKKYLFRQPLSLEAGKQLES